MVTVRADSDAVVSEVDKRVFGSFVEHMGRAIYTGIYEPQHPSADADGMRQDVIDAVREMGVSLIRYPGGNFVSAYNWEDGVGPREKRPTRLDLAWHSLETNEVGIHEFTKWSAKTGADLLLTVNLGTRGVREACEFVEYVNHPGGTEVSERRRANGRTDPWDVRLWCLGNEMDGPWTIGQRSAESYGEIANQTASALRRYDPELEFIVSGSSSDTMPMFPEWDATVLKHTYDSIDYISMHRYFGQPDDEPDDTYLAKSLLLDDYIASVAAVIRYVKAGKRSKKDVHIAVQEWNIWHSLGKSKAKPKRTDPWVAGAALFEDDYTFVDGLLVGCILNTLIRRADVVKIACMAQLVNVIAPIKTIPGGGIVRNPTFFPFALASRLGRGTALNLVVAGPRYDCGVADSVPFVDVAGVHDSDQERINFFLVNRSSEDQPLELHCNGFGNLALSENHVIVEGITPADVRHTTLAQVRCDAGSLSAVLPARSYTVLSLSTRPKV